MIIGIGIDAVEIERFQNWHKYQINTLKKIFSDEEIKYCLSNDIKSAERFAVRFAAKEATFKAMSHILDKKITFQELCKYIKIYKLDDIPELSIDWERLELKPKFLPICKISQHISITHSKFITCATIIFEKN